MSFDVQRAVRSNRHYYRTLPWGRRYEQVVQILGLPDSPSEENFAIAVAQWQERHRPLGRDGVLGPATWRRMEPQTRFSAEGVPGRIRRWSNGGLSGVLLTHFDFDRTEVKPEHSAWLRGLAMRLLGQGGVVYIIGLTDRTGSDAYNFDLSERRARAVYAELRRHLQGSTPAVFQVVGFGKRLAAAQADRAGSDRGVAVCVDHGQRPGPVPAWLRLMFRPEASGRFYIRSLFSLSVSLPTGIGGAALHLEISDGLWNQIYVAGGVQIEVALPVPSMTGEGPWHQMRVALERRVDQFHGTVVKLAGGRAIDAPVLELTGPYARVQPFLLGAGIDLSIGSYVKGGLQRLPGAPLIARGVPLRIQRHLARGGAPGDATKE